jgi:hypothetical protein
MTGLKDAMRGARLLALAAAAMAPAMAARAEGTVFGGALFGDTQTEYLGVSMPLPGARVGQGLAVRAIVSGSQYKYDAFVGTVHGKDIRADVSLLYQISNAHNYFDFGIGPRYVDVRLNPRDPGNPREGGHWEGVVSASGQHTYDPWYVSEFGSYGTDGRDYFVRGDVTHRISGPFRLGVEAEADGARDYSRRSVGAVLAISAAPGWEVKISGGATDQSHRTGGYGGVTFRTSF